jgi:hypothetical protein
LPELPADRYLREPVGWLLGPELLAKLSKMVRKRVDPRRWMAWTEGVAHDELHEPQSTSAEAERLAKEPPRRKEIWFDYVADTGDSSDGMYAIAYACQISFHGLPSIRSADIPPEGLELQQAAAHEAALLPRGEFLFVGGDSAYHVADKATILARVKEPFDWAFADLGLSENEPRRRLYGIPGNHDWYDDIEGFERLFGKSASGLGIELKGFERVQRTSYVAIQLPHEWQIWGLDIDTPLDRRQQSYFDAVRAARERARPEAKQGVERLILCTPSPPIVLGRVAPHGQHEGDLSKLRISHAYRPEVSLDPRSARLDLSGDTHHYTRYQLPGKPNYSAVVSGLGGAFLHPTFTTVGALEPAALYPSKQTSLEETAPRLLTYKTLVLGSWVRVFPFLFTLLLGLASNASGGVGWLLNHCCSWLFPLPAFPSPNSTADSAFQQPSGQLWSALLLLLTLLLAGVLVWLAVKLFQKTADAQGNDPSLRRRFSFSKLGFGPGQAFHPHRSYWLSTSLVIGAAVLLLGFLHSPYSPRASVAGLDTLSILLALLGPVGGAIAGWLVGAPDGMARLRKLRIALLGSAHGFIQMLTALSCARLVTASLPASLSWTTLHWASLSSPLAGAAVVLVTLFALLPLTRPLFRHRLPGLLAIAALLSWLAAMSALVFVAPAELPAQSGPLAFLYFAIAALVPAFLGPAYFGWYLAIAGLLDGHNNEVGGAARITAHREIIRFHIDSEGALTGYVISAEQVGTPARGIDAQNQLKFRLIDRFTVAAGV